MSKCPKCGYEKPKNDKQRSSPENRYLHGCVVPLLAEHWNYSEYDTKAFIKLWYRIKESSSLTTVQFEDWMRLLRQDVATPDSEINRHFDAPGIFIPQPNEAIE
jgi:hypothetical protein